MLLWFRQGLKSLGMLDATTSFLSVFVLLLHNKQTTRCFCTAKSVCSEIVSRRQQQTPDGEWNDVLMGYDFLQNAKVMWTLQNGIVVSMWNVWCGCWLAVVILSATSSSSVWSWQKVRSWTHALVLKNSSSITNRASVLLHKATHQTLKCMCELRVLLNKCGQQQQMNVLEHHDDGNHY